MSSDFWSETAHEAVQELKDLADEDLYDQHMTEFINNVFIDLEKTWNPETTSDGPGSESERALPER